MSDDWDFSDTTEVDLDVLQPDDWQESTDGFERMPPSARTAFEIWRQLGRPADAKLSSLCGVSVNQVRTWRRSFQWELRLQDLEDGSESDQLAVADILKLTAAARRQAVFTLMDVMESDHPIARVKAAQELLDRSGVTKQLAHEIIHGELQASDEVSAVDVEDPEAILRELRRQRPGTMA